MKLHVAFVTAVLTVVALVMLDRIAPYEWFGSEEAPNDLGIAVFLVFALSAVASVALLVAEIVRWLARGGSRRADA